MKIVELFPGARPRRWEGLEAVVELIEDTPDPFSAPGLHRAIRGRYGDVQRVISDLLALDLIERVTPESQHLKPVYYRRTA